MQVKYGNDSGQWCDGDYDDGDGDGGDNNSDWHYSDNVNSVTCDFIHEYQYFLPEL